MEDEEAYFRDEEVKQHAIGNIKNQEITTEEFNKRPLIKFANAKQIIEECEKILKDESVAEELNEDGSSSKKLLTFRELLSWKMPDHFCSTSNANNKQFNRHRIQAGIDGTGAPVIQNQINLYKYDFVTQRLREQLVSFCGIVTHI